jgi:hypothetical protein
MEAAPQALRDAVVAALAASGALLAPAAGAAGDEAAGPLGVECPGGGGGEGPQLVYSRGALSRCDAPRLRATLVSAAEGAARAADEAQGSADAGLLRQLIGQLKGQPDEAVVVEARVGCKGRMFAQSAARDAIAYARMCMSAVRVFQVFVKVCECVCVCMCECLMAWV